MMTFHPPPRLLVAMAAIALCAVAASAQIGELLSPGPLSAPHAKLDGAANCVKCHEQGRRVSAQRCLACHAPIADRIARRKGVHRNVKDDCVSCHVEHAGRDAELRPIDVRNFDHRLETGFALDGLHVPLKCTSCHPTRSFLLQRSDCASCHKDPHKGTLGTDCAKCHSTAVAFKTAGTGFDHSRTAFPLDGAHRPVACAKCHIDGRYKGLPFASCADCHKNPHNTRMGADCHSCHTTGSWKVARFDHAKTGTPLLGKHQTTACEKCHVRPATQVRIALQPCSTCHRDPHGGAFRQDCASCHDQRSFRGAAYEHAKTRFPLTGKHSELTCSRCHKRAPQYGGLDPACASCHTDPHKGQLGTACATCHTAETFRIARFEHPRFPDFFGGQHGKLTCDGCHRRPEGKLYKGLSTDCATCHRDVHLGQVPRCTDCHTVAAAKFEPVLFRHDRADFSLTGKHAAAACRSCHKQETGTFPAGTGTAVRLSNVTHECAGCHKDVHLGQVGRDCQRCHTSASFAVATIEHRAIGWFFEGRHGKVACAQCHKRVDGSFPAGAGHAVRLTGIGTECSACHDDIHRGQLGADCASCHTVDAPFRTASRAFHKAGLFPLTGRHLTVPCADCHRDGVIQGTPTRCFDCHWIRRSDDAYHTHLGNECEDCHTTESWAAANWDHAANTGFPLNAEHRSLACDQCHTRRLFAAEPADCAACHTDEYVAAAEPDHDAAGFPLVCQLCHRAGDPTWREARFDHSSFALAGVHATEVCASCHPGGVYAGTPRDCGTCHRADYERSTSPNHAAAGFSITCESCHAFTDPSWSAAAYAHQVWPLLGAHSGPQCSSCHKTTVYAGLQSDCVSCHRQAYDTSADPAHAAAGFPLTCESCHRIADPDWHAAVFDHGTFALAGAHATGLCSACHGNGVYAGTPRTCEGCHDTDFAQAQEPNHVAAAFPRTCDSCHSYTDPSWDLGHYDHGTFALLGSHATEPCASCHLGSVYAGTSRVCSGCHLDDFNTAAEPNHVTAGFPLSCDGCHQYTDPSWDLGRYDHSTFPLAGVHLEQVCLVCHRNDVYAGTPRTCEGCHLAEYTASTDPPHAAAAFPTQCDLCHQFSDPDWTLAVFNHTTFTLAGVHATEPCGSCHINNVYAGTPRTCLGCHLDDYDATTDPRHVTAGFPTTCDSCHRFTDTSWDQGTFDHGTFPLSGVHRTEPCDSCHANGVYDGTSRICSGCHLDDYNAARDPNHIAAGFPTTCDSCHRFADSSWDQGVFNHSFFPITSGDHSGNECNECHPNASNYSVFICTTCHIRSETDDQHQDEPGYTYESAACLSCHPSGRAD